MPNHIFQLITLMAMEPPISFEADAVRLEEDQRMILAGDIGAAIRAKLLKAFEIAEIEVDPARHRDLLTFVLAGAGPTGVEIPLAVADMLRGILKSDFRRIDPRTARVKSTCRHLSIIRQTIVVPPPPNPRGQPRDLAIAHIS